jgi:hypothetical protein
MNSLTGHSLTHFFMAPVKTGLNPAIGRVMETTYNIPTQNLDLLQKQIDKLNKACAKLNLNPITITVLRTFTLESEKRSGAFTFKEINTFHEVMVTGSTPKLAGWTFLGVIDHKGGNMVHTVPGQKVPEEYWGAEDLCGHCNTKRNRNETFIVRHEFGRTLQVGRNCLADFLGHANPEAVVKACEWLASFDTDMGNPDSEWYGTGELRSIDLRSLLICTTAYIRDNGWVSRSKAEGGMATADGVWEYLTSPQGARHYKKCHGKDLEHWDEDGDTAAKAIQWALDQKPDSEYIHNLHAIVDLGAVTYRTVGYAASIVACYQRDARKAEARAAKPESNHVGEVKERRHFTVTVEAIHYFEGNWGPTTLFRMRDKEGNLIVWFASGEPHMLKDQTYTLKATIKAHDEFKGAKQTVITRAVVEQEVA